MSSAESSHRVWHPLPDWFRELAAQEPGAVLLETAKFDDENFRTLLFRDPVAELIANSAEELPAILKEIDHHVDEGRYVSGFVAYECGEMFNNLPQGHQETYPAVPLLRMGVFRAPLIFDHLSGSIDGEVPPLSKMQVQDDSETRIEESTLQATEFEYAEKIRRIQQYLAAGHSYQVNYTERIAGTFAGSAMALYRGLLMGQSVSYAAFMDCGYFQVLSFSPELFYRTAHGRITVRPMKGTWPRGVTLEEDEDAAQQLREDEKNRAEHVMIVDLLRNDIGRVCQMGSVQVERFMEVERYRTLHQLTSTVSGALDATKSPTQIFTALFPSGSITGAPKRRTMEIIRELEQGTRGIYTGAIGWFGPRGDACFNVAIRTVVAGQQSFTLGVGGGITVGSDAVEEFRECQLKASFLQNLGREFQLIETMCAIGATVPLLEGHMRRLRRSAAYFQIPFHEEELRTDLAGRLAVSHGDESRVRLTLDERGRWMISSGPLERGAWSGRIRLSSSRTTASDVFLHHKTTQRALYQRDFDNARKNGFDEVLFMNRDGLVTEGAISNVFLVIDGALVTPDASCGLLPGVFRQQMLDRFYEVESRMVRLQDLLAADEVWFCNALRGSRPARAILDGEGRILWARSDGGV